MGELHDEAAARAKAFFTEVMTTEPEPDHGELRRILRDHYPDIKTPEQETAALRYLGANFFRIIGVTQPRTAKGYRKALQDFIDSSATQ